MQVTVVVVKVTEKEKRGRSFTTEQLFLEVSWFNTLQPSTELTVPRSVYLKYTSGTKANAGLFRTYTYYRFKEPHL